MGHHIDGEGRFQSDKHPELPPDRIRLNFNNPLSRRALLALAEDYAEKDPELAADILKRLSTIKGDLEEGVRESRARRSTEPGLYYLTRLADQTGVSGTGHVAQVAVFEDGSAAVRWTTGRDSTVVWSRVEDMVHVHIDAHPGSTILEAVSEPQRRAQKAEALLEAISTDLAQDALEDPKGHAERRERGLYQIRRGVVARLRLLMDEMR